jgi:nicotinamidase/pyrazinamidase
MREILFWDVDTQHDFMVPDGKLYVPDAEHLAPNLKRLTEFARTHDIPIVASVDDHEPEDREIRGEPDFETVFPPHCLHGTAGARKIPATAMRHPLEIPWDPEDPEALRERVLDHDGEILIRKKEFDVFANPNTGTVLAALDPSDVVLYGVALDVCDRHAIEGMLRHGGITVHLVTDAAQALKPERAGDLIRDWLGRGVRTVTTDAIVDGNYLKRS